LCADRPAAPLTGRRLRGSLAYAAGVDAEAAACAALVRDGWTVLARRLRTAAGSFRPVNCYTGRKNWGEGMRRYLIFAALVPLLGGFWLLLTATLMSRYWVPPSFSEAAKLFTVFATTLQYSYLFGILPALMIGAVDDILFHVKRMGAVTRMLDLIVGSSLLLATAPLMLILALAVWLDLRLPPLFRQVRVVGHGRLATIAKLRTLRPAGDPETTWVVTAGQSSPLGKLLRTTHADELPQLASVVRGDMALVGPRPERPYFASRLRRSVRGYAQRDRVRAGLTGWAQVNGLTGDTSIEDRARFDNFYIEYWSIWLDLLILARTGLAALSGVLTKGGNR